MQRALRRLAALEPPRVAVCNDCHTPHDLVGKYITKARNGFWHSFYFTTGTFHEPIRITPRNRASPSTRAGTATPRSSHAIDTVPTTGERARAVSRCHRAVGHLH